VADPAHIALPRRALFAGLASLSVAPALRAAPVPQLLVARAGNTVLQLPDLLLGEGQVGVLGLVEFNGPAGAIGDWLGGAITIDELQPGEKPVPWRGGDR
jgi:hypothetical protein